MEALEFMNKYLNPFVLFIVCVSSIVLFGIVKAKLSKKFKIKVDYASWESCDQAKKMLLRFLYDSMDGLERRHSECVSAKCHGLSTLWDSADCTELIDLVHSTGGRLVLRKKSDDDIEVSEHTPDEFHKILKRLDVSRQRMHRKKNRR